MLRHIALWLAAGAALMGCQANHPASYEQRAAPTVEDEVRAFLRAHRMNGSAIGRQARFHLGTADLDGDRQDEALVWLDDRDFCGTGGCNLLVLRRAGASWREVTRLTITWPPIRVLESRTNGWKDLAVRVSGGGISPGYQAVLPFDGRTYPANPTMSPSRQSDGAGQGRVVISGDNPLRLYEDG